MPLRLTPVSVAIPELLVVADPTEFPFNVNAMVLPLTGAPPDVRVNVAARVDAPPYVPAAGATDIVVDAAAFTVCATGAEVLAANVVLPLYTATIECEPADSVDVVHVA